MKFHVFSVYDGAASAFLPPFFLPAMGQAIRAFTDAVNDPNHQFAKHATDYSLWCIGIFDDSAGELSCDSSGKVKVVDAVSVLIK